MDRELRAMLAGGASELGIDLAPEELERFGAYLHLLRTWGSRINLTSHLEPREIVVHHFLDSLAGARWVEAGEEGRLLDVGTGAGFPGLPLKIVRPRIHVVLLDGAGRRVSFCRQVIREAGLSEASAEWGRAEEFAGRPGFAHSFRWVTSRAVAKAAALVELGFPFLAPGGALLLYKGKPDEREMGDLAAACSSRGLSLEANPVVVPGLDAARTILVARRPLR